MAADERFEGSRDREIHIFGAQEQAQKISLYKRIRNHCSDVIVKKMREYRLHY